MRKSTVISSLLGTCLLMLVLLTGCAKDELMPPLDSSDSMEMKSDAFSSDSEDIKPLDGSLNDKDPRDRDEITDDEDDEEDDQRVVNR